MSESQIGTIGTSLVPSLDSSRDRVENDGQVERARELEAVRKLLADSEAVGFFEFLDIFKCRGVLGEQSAFDEEWLYILKVVLASEPFDVGEEVWLRNSSEGIADPLRMSILGKKVVAFTYSPSRLDVKLAMLALRFCSSSKIEPLRSAVGGVAPSECLHCCKQHSKSTIRCPHILDDVLVRHDESPIEKGLTIEKSSWAIWSLNPVRGELFICRASAHSFWRHKAKLPCQNFLGSARCCVLITRFLAHSQ